MSETLRPARATAPGRIILRELETRGWTQQDLAAVMGRPEQVISEIIRAKKQITAETARQLAKAFGTSPDFWLNLEMQYQLHQAGSAGVESQIERRSRLFALAPINEMIKRGWIRASDTVDELEREFCRFFQLASVEQSPRVAVKFRLSGERGPEDRAILAWVKRVEQLAAEQEIDAFIEGTVPELVERLLGLAENQAELVKIPQLLLEYGIHFVFVPHLPKTYLDGAALKVEEHPVVAITLRYDRIDAFWFTLFHELAHIHLKHELVHVDQLFGGESPIPGSEEIEASRLASQWLLPEDLMTEFIELNAPRYSRQNIERFASEQHLHPGIVIGQLMHRKEMKYSHLREYLVKVSPMLEMWKDGNRSGMNFIH